jgi:hypothetical protein
VIVWEAENCCAGAALLPRTGRCLFIGFRYVAASRL